ncbi:MAG: cobalt ECF transporter T component CbiQ [Methanobacteriaceae archaeon]|jgi:cobalt/nickel transport system permease protein|nr:cobalt ECF transporter T component CbiQ [Methanobacteriaceae archaeon]MDO9626383.1 cobalt ECF transporter T component CbiQ [Methanobacteriaceae archaeon]MDP2837487.1 cobalt ECF transporter T component CbiQ [Methanobacteriaceae archaeon]
MFENTLDNFAHHNGLRGTNVYLKVLFALLTMLVSLISTSPVVPIIITFLMSFLIIFKAKIPWKFYLKFLAIPFIFGFLTFVFMAFFFGVGATILELNIFNLVITVDGFNLGFLVFARVMGGFSCMAFLAFTTPMTELFSVLDTFKIPKIVLEIAMMMYRYIFVFLDESLNMYYAQQTRLGYQSFKTSYKSLGMLASNLFIRSWIKGERVYVSMESRGYNGSLYINNYQNSIGIKNLTILVLFESVLILGVYLSGNFRLF